VLPDTLGKVFYLPTLKRIYDATNLCRTLKEHVRWGALIGLYAGARVSEVLAKTSWASG
jgi:hypothetical protein